ncbi:MAG: TetR/AcrR family transcriptional regulator [Acholeplasmatales bacterium]|nr:TetR/AcrR family transcriptional regulator [Acholeplasmatales bacterium]
MDKNESKFYNSSIKMNNALISLLDKKDFEDITVKEICQTATVNRSTFYLHYENTYDLLKETIENLYKDFFSRYDSNLSMDRINNKSNDDLFLITPKYLKPYLSFVQDNKKIFKLMYFKNEVFNGRNMYEDWLDKIFRPILSKFNVKNEEEQSYIMLFHLQGLIGLIMEWVKNDCKMPIDVLINVIQKCIKTPN